jgi:hypothetical protein
VWGEGGGEGGEKVDDVVLISMDIEGWLWFDAGGRAHALLPAVSFSGCAVAMCSVSESSNGCCPLREEYMRRM